MKRWLMGLVLLVWALPGWAFLVTDAEMVTALLDLRQAMQQWNRMVTHASGRRESDPVFNRLLYDFQYFNQVFLRVKNAKLTPEEAARLGLGSLERLLKSPFLDQCSQIESWREVFARVRKVWEVYHSLGRDPLQDNPLLSELPRESPLRQVVQRTQAIARETVQEWQGQAEFLADMRTWERERLTQLEQYDRLLKRFSGVGNDERKTGADGLLLALEIDMAIEELQQGVQECALVRVQIENRIKQIVRGKASDMTWLQGSAPQPAHKER